MRKRLLLALVVLIVGHMLHANAKVNIGVILVEISHELKTTLEISGLISTVSALGQGVSGLFAGWFLARRGLRAALFTGLVWSSLALLLTAWSNSVLQFVLLRILLGFGQGVWIVGYLAAAGMLSVRHRGLTIGGFLAMFDIGLLWGNPIAAWLVQLSGTWRDVPMVFGIAGLALGLVCIYFPEPLVAGHPLRINHASDYSQLLHNRNITLSAFASLFWSFVYFSILGLLPTYLRETLGYSVLDTALLTSVFILGDLIVGPPLAALSDRIGRRGIIIFGGASTAVTAVMVFNIPEHSTFFFVALLIFLVGASQVSGYSVVLSFAQDSVDDSHIGSAMGILNAAVSSGAGFAGLIFGYFVTVGGWGIGSIWLSAAGLGWFFVAIFTKGTKRRENCGERSEN